MENKRLYNIWACMKQRCYNPNHTAAKWYHDKGIRVCDDWIRYRGFEKWALNNGYSDDLTIDRIDSEGNYEPNNCRWISFEENASRARHVCSRGKRTIKKEGKYEIVYRVIGLYEIVRERGYSYSYAIKRIAELEEKEKLNIGFFLKRKIDKSKDVGVVYMYN